MQSHWFKYFVDSLKTKVEATHMFKCGEVSKISQHGLCLNDRITLDITVLCSAQQ